VQRGVVERQYAEFGITHFAIEFLMALIKRTELLITLDQTFDILLLVLEHQPTSSSHGHDAAARTRRHIVTGWWERVDWISESRFTLACASPAGGGEVCGVVCAAVSIMDSLFVSAAAAKSASDDSTLLPKNLSRNGNFWAFQAIESRRFFARTVVKIW
jgi:hypothetical protein